MVERQCKWTGKMGIVVLMFVGLAAFSTRPAQADGMRFRLNFSYVSGLQDLADAYEEDIEAAEPFTEVDSTVIPVGISLFPYYQWDSGLFLGAGIGPFIFLWAEGDDDYTHWEIPVSFNVGYVFGPDNPVSFYVRGGPSYHFADGDFYDSSTVGVTGAIGLEFFKSSHAAMGLEASYDSAEVKIEKLATGRNEGIKTTEFSAGLFVMFK
jgi:hypothetical protein